MGASTGSQGQPPWPSVTQGRGLPAIACDCLSVIAFRTLGQKKSRP